MSDLKDTAAIGEFPIIIRGEEYTLRFDWRAMYELQVATKKSLAVMMAKDGSGFGVIELVESIRCGLLHINSKKKLTTDKVCQMLEPGKYAYYISCCTDGISALVGTGDEDDEDDEGAEGDGGEEDTSPLASTGASS